jgi:hypothetical protein
MTIDDMRDGDGSGRPGSAGASDPAPSPVRWAVGMLVFMGVACAVMAVLFGFIGAGSPSDRAVSYPGAGVFVLLGVLYATAAVLVRRGRRSGKTISRGLFVVTAFGAVAALLFWHAIGGVFLVCLGWITLWMLGKPPARAYLVRP